jgi:hypothetical protein
MTGSAPGSPRQTGHTWVFGGAPSYAVEQAQNIFDAVRSWQWTSIPMTASYRSRAAAPMLDADVSIAIAEESRIQPRQVARTASGGRVACGATDGDGFLQTLS